MESQDKSFYPISYQTDWLHLTSIHKRFWILHPSLKSFQILLLSHRGSVRWPPLGISVLPARLQHVAEATASNGGRSAHCRFGSEAGCRHSWQHPAFALRVCEGSAPEVQCAFPHEEWYQSLHRRHRTVGGSGMFKITPKPSVLKSENGIHRL
jgi:hypothetical protein